MTRFLAPAVALTLMLAWAPTAAAQEDGGCALCHGELELLRQHADRLEDARGLLVTPGDIAGSAHSEQTCSSCHTGFDRWPHVAEASTATCASCHEEAGALWSDGIHANVDEAGADAASCVSCHGIHTVLPAAELAEGEGMLALNARCVTCHETTGLPPVDPHADEVSCTSCHQSHDLRDTDDPRSSLAPLTQAVTCGACHEDPARLHGQDVHGEALAEGGEVSLTALTLLGAEGPPTCTSCHGGHGMLAIADTAAAGRAVAQCSSCHQDWADRYLGTYHGKATALGSSIVATCDDCHSAHEIQPAANPASWVHADNLVETCATCHEHARPAFVAYDSHPDPMDRSRNAPLFYSFVFMNTLLLSVLVIFGLHTALWWVRILLDQRKAGAEGGSHV